MANAAEFGRHFSQFFNPAQSQNPDLMVQPNDAMNRIISASQQLRPRLHELKVDPKILQELKNRKGPTIVMLDRKLVAQARETDKPLPVDQLPQHIRNTTFIQEYLERLKAKASSSSNQVDAQNTIDRQQGYVDGSYMKSSSPVQKVATHDGIGSVPIKSAMPGEMQPIVNKPQHQYHSGSTKSLSNGGFVSQQHYDDLSRDKLHTDPTKLSFPSRNVNSSHALDVNGIPKAIMPLDPTQAEQMKSKPSMMVPIRVQLAGPAHIPLTVHFGAPPILYLRLHFEFPGGMKIPFQVPVNITGLAQTKNLNVGIGLDLHGPFKQHNATDPDSKNIKVTVNEINKAQPPETYNETSITESAAMTTTDKIEINGNVVAADAKTNVVTSKDIHNTTEVPTASTAYTTPTVPTTNAPEHSTTGSSPTNVGWNVRDTQLQHGRSGGIHSQNAVGRNRVHMRKIGGQNLAHRKSHIEGGRQKPENPQQQGSGFPAPKRFPVIDFDPMSVHRFQV
ncbi:hypothetical protein ACJMK2_004911 [Sinanodonta woodiana]|uniref:Uncharacterized protein n=1 Tax=Sinanodonta woodiana TaxID=1069815 RepID=A0ABD3VNR0_SINWO